MDQNFQTSFIPKKPMIEDRAKQPRSINLLTIISIFIFFTIVIGCGGLYFYESILSKKISQMSSDLNLAKNRFEPSKIIQLQVLNKRLRASNEILSKHIAISPIFEVLEKITINTISYTKFSYEFDENAKNPKINVKMGGMAQGYKSVALQAELFAKNKNLIDPVFSNLSLDEKGNVLFDLDFSVDPNFVDYKKVIEARGENVATSVTNNQIN